jgi:hypothetical protein
VPSDDWVVFKDIRHTLVNQQSPDQEERGEEEAQMMAYHFRISDFVNERLGV